MTARDFALALAALLLGVLALVGMLATHDLEPCWPDCRARFDGAPGVRHG